MMHFEYSREKIMHGHGELEYSVGRFGETIFKNTFSEKVVI